MFKLGGTQINQLFLGNTEIKKAYLGSTLIHDKTGGGGGGALAVDFLDSQATSANLATYDFTGLNAGSQAGTWLAVAVVCVQRTVGSRGYPITSATINGVPATVAAEYAGINGAGANRNSVAIIYAEIPAAATVDVSVTYGRSHVHAGCALFAVTGYASPTPVNPVVAEADPAASLTVIAGGVGIAGCAFHDAHNGGQPVSWSGASVAVDSGFVSNETGRWSAAVVPAAGNVTASYPESYECALVAASWQ